MHIATHSLTYSFRQPYHKLTNIKDCLARGFIKEGETPLEVAAQQLIKDGINVSKYYTYSHMFVLFISMKAHLTLTPPL